MCLPAVIHIKYINSLPTAGIVLPVSQLNTSDCLSAKISLSLSSIAKISSYMSMRAS